MAPKRIYLKKTTLYCSTIGIGLSLLLAGDKFQVDPFSLNAAKAPIIAINPDDWQSLAQAVEKRADRFGGNVGYIIKDFSTGQVAGTNEDEAFPSASLIKIPILCAAFQAAEDRKFSLSAPVTLLQRDKRGGSGILKLSPAGRVYTNRELLEAMIVHSDNTATELVLRQMGYDYMQETFAKLGLQDTLITPQGFRLTSRRIKGDNMTSPRDMAHLLEKMYKRELVSARASDEMLDILKHQKLRDRLPRFLPTGWEIAHKTGLLRKACHDVGIVFSPKGDYMICVLTSQERTYKKAKQFIASIGQITYGFYSRADVPVNTRSS
jgi:beta-lactamase class A